VKRIARACAAALILSVCHGAIPGTAQQSGGVKQRSAPPPEIQKALILEQQGQYPEAQAAWEEVVRMRPRDGQAYAHLGLLQARQEHYPEAIALYRKAQALNPSIAQLNFNLGLALFKSDHFREAAKIFEAELRKNPKSSNAARLTILAGMAHYGAREYGAAISYLKEAAEAEPHNLQLQLTLAHCYLWTKQLDATMATYKQILLIDPDSAEADMIAGEALDEEGDNAGAVREFRAAALANPKETNVHFGLAYLLWAQKRYDEAIPEFKAELANDPRNNQAMIYLGDTYVKQSQFQDGKVVLEEAARYQTSNPLIHLDLGIVYMETGDNTAAIRELNKAVELEPDNVAAHFRLATIYRSMGKKDEARAEFAKSNSLNKKHDDSLHQRIADANARPETNAEPAETAKPADGSKPSPP
jgi:tetratricopeptide (TPR) repeat protein